MVKNVYLGFSSHGFTYLIFENINISRPSSQNDFYYTRVPGFSDIGRTREGPRFSITFALYVKKIFIQREFD
jgi:hypothetical protein